MTNQPETAPMDVYSAVRWSAVSQYGSQAVRTVVSLVLARLLAPEYFGLLAMAGVITAFARQLTNLGFTASIIQRKQISPQLVSTLFWANLAISVLMAVALAACSPLAAWIYSDPRVAPIVAVLSVEFLLVGFTMVPTALLTRRMAFNKLAVRELAGVLLGGSTSITLAVLGWGVWALVLGSLVGLASGMILINLLCPFRPQLVFDRQGLRECLGFGLNLTGFGIFNYFARNADNLIIGIFLGPTALGYYSLAYRLMLLPRDSVTNVITRVLFPAFSRMQDDDERLANAYLRTCGAIAFVTFPMMAGLAVVARPFVEVVLGAKWLPAVPLIWILAPVGMMHSINATTGQLYLAKARTDWMFYWGVGGAGLLALSFPLGLPWGVTGVASAYLIMNLLIVLPCYWIPFRLVRGLSLARLFRAVSPFACSSAVMALGVISCGQVLKYAAFGKNFSLVFCVSTGVILYAFVAVFLHPATLQDVTRLLPIRLPLGFAQSLRNAHRR